MFGKDRRALWGSMERKVSPVEFSMDRFSRKEIDFNVKRPFVRFIFISNEKTPALINQQLPVFGQ